MPRHERVDLDRRSDGMPSHVLHRNPGFQWSVPHHGVHIAYPCIGSGHRSHLGELKVSKVSHDMAPRHQPFSIPVFSSMPEVLLWYLT